FAAYVYLSEERIAELPVVQGCATNAPAAPSAPEEAPAEGAAAIPEVVVNVAPVSGFNLGGHVKGLSSNTVSAMRRAGMSWVKKQFRYSGQEPSAVAGMINEAHGSG